VCNLYSLNKNRDTVGRFFRVSHNRIVSFEPSSGIFPRHVAPVVRRAADGERDQSDPCQSLKSPNHFVIPRMNR